MTGWASCDPNGENPCCNYHRKTRKCGSSKRYCRDSGRRAWGVDFRKAQPPASDDGEDDEEDQDAGGQWNFDGWPSEWRENGWTADDGTNYPPDPNWQGDSDAEAPQAANPLKKGDFEWVVGPAPDAGACPTLCGLGPSTLQGTVLCLKKGKPIKRKKACRRRIPGGEPAPVTTACPATEACATPTPPPTTAGVKPLDALMEHTRAQFAAGSTLALPSAKKPPVAIPHASILFFVD